MSATDVAELRAQMDEARRPPAAAALHPSRSSWRRSRASGGKISAARAGPLRDHARPGRAAESRHGARRRRPDRTRYDRVTFDIDHVLDGAKPPAELLAPGHPLHDAVTDETVAQLASARSTAARSSSRRAVRERDAAPARRRRARDRRRGTRDDGPARRFGYAVRRPARRR